MTLPRFAILTSLALLTMAALAQEDGRVLVTQTLVHADSKTDVVPTATQVKLELDSKNAPVTSLVPVAPGNVQIAFLIDDGLSRNAGIQLNDLKQFAMSLPPTTELLVGYMTNGTVQVASPFSTDHAAAAAAFRIPTGLPGESASPYFCLSDFVKHWPGSQGEEGTHKARFVMMLTNGVDPYNGSTRITNQDSPYVSEAVEDAQRAGVAVYSIYYRDSGFRGNGSASFSGQGYLQQVADATGGDSYYEGTGSPVSLAPFLKQFQHAISETYVATFNAPADAGGRDHLIRVKMSSSVPKLKLRHADEVRPGNLETARSTAAMQ
jgi:hypothetical protein